MPAGVDKSAKERHGLDGHAVDKLSEAYRAGWLHNVLSRITPLTLRRRNDYVAMADLFILNEEEAENVLNRFDADLELFCSVAEITVTKHMNSKNVSEELKAHVQLYNDVANVFYRKFGLEKRDPIEGLAISSMMMEASNPFVKEFVDKHFNRDS